MQEPPLKMVKKNWVLLDADLYVLSRVPSCGKSKKLKSTRGEPSVHFSHQQKHMYDIGCYIRRQCMSAFMAKKVLHQTVQCIDIFSCMIYIYMISLPSSNCSNFFFNGGHSVLNFQISFWGLGFIILNHITGLTI